MRAFFLRLMLLLCICSIGSDANSAGLENPDSGNPKSTPAFSTPASSIQDSVIPADRATRWNPGILSDDQLRLPLGPDGIPSRVQICATLHPGENIQKAIDDCPDGEVVKLNPGTFNVADTVQLTKGIVLRGAGSDGAPSGTTIVKSGGGTVLAIGKDRDFICYNGMMPPGVNLVEDGVKESTTLNVGRSGISATSARTNFSPGDLALVDLLDGPTVQQGDCSFFKRLDRRSVSQRVEIRAVDKNTGNLTLGSPLHWNFRAGGSYQAQISRVTSPTIRWAGVENLKIMGGTNNNYPGATAGGIDISNAAYCWVKDIQTSGTIGGVHISLTGTYRCVVRDSYVHHSAEYGFGKDCYGIVLKCGSAENLIENNIARFMNKPIQLNTTGGGNVIAYNYADNAWSTPGEWQETSIDTHCSFPHMELIEGNIAPHIGIESTHGNSGYLTFFRNYASSQFASPAVWNDGSLVQTRNVAAMIFSGGAIGMNVIGNILGSTKTTTATASRTYESADVRVPSIYNLGNGGAGLADVAATTLLRAGNYDTIHKSVVWADAPLKLPPSLYLSSRPAWWPSEMPWPWAGPDLEPMVGTLPAKLRSDTRYKPPSP
ncbi:right-handed parallel beta-helix repeat-containing protein [Bradyrhizobium symbiodeficiens]|uniref:Right-handed parallel beta-helix repeat-containing protein n=1 Tax=Bradyrhizobium symbiodeficiens TaxID=1404367 RepID=A0A6G8ZZ45_9BRAD|nr:right-handed parallel beta-helix repeat-containing protein [Bradyrhizobium symbiodeficiens]QIP05492.1 hypothetical protein HAV00_04150 [Bradyrhizobium symbiodeficiens]